MAEAMEIDDGNDKMADENDNPVSFSVVLFSHSIVQCSVEISCSFFHEKINK